MGEETLGRRGESIAGAYLVRLGYNVLQCNWRYKRLGEIDVVAYCPQSRTLRFVEVKTRQSRQFGTPLEAVNAAKQATLRTLAELYMAQTTLPNPVEGVAFDVVGVELLASNPNEPLVTYYPDAF